MDKQEWIEQIPFYLNGTLNETEHRQFEQVLRKHPDWQQEIEEWRVIADAVYQDANAKAKMLPPISARVREELTAPSNPAADDEGLTLIPPPSQQRPQSQPMPTAQQGQNRRRLTTNVVAGFVTLAAAAAILLTAGILFLAVGDDNTDLTPAAVALGGTETEVAQTEESGAPPIPLATNTARPTAIMPPTATIVNPPAVPTPLPGSDSGLENPSAAQLSVPQQEAGSGGGGGSAFDTPMEPEGSIPGPGTAARGNCYVERPLGTGPIPIYQFADTSSDVIGSMQPGQQLDTWINTPKGPGEVYYQVFLPNGSTRLGWVDGTQVNLYGPDDSTTCTDIMQPTPTNPAFPGNAPTPFPDGNTCRVSSATGGTVPVYRVPDTGSAIVGSLALGDLMVAREFYTGVPGWYRVIVPGVGFGYLQTDSVNTNGNCNTLPQTDSFEQPTPQGSAQSAPVRPTLSATACRVVGLSNAAIPIYNLPAPDALLITNLNDTMIDNETWFVTRQTTDNEWFYLSELVDGRYEQRGWAQRGNLALEGACDSQPAISATDWAATVQPPATRPALPTPTQEVISP